MSVRLDGAVIRLEGDCRLEAAESLVALLCDGAARTVDLTACGRMHGAVLQALLSFAPPITGEPVDGFLRELVTPNLRPAPISGESRADGGAWRETEI